VLCQNWERGAETSPWLWMESYGLISLGGCWWEGRGGGQRGGRAQVGTIVKE